MGPIADFKQKMVILLGFESFCNVDFGFIQVDVYESDINFCQLSHKLHIIMHKNSSLIVLLFGKEWVIRSELTL